MMLGTGMIIKEVATQLGGWDVERFSNAALHQIAPVVDKRGQAVTGEEYRAVMAKIRAWMWNCGLTLIIYLSCTW